MSPTTESTQSSLMRVLQVDGLQRLPLRRKHQPVLQQTAPGSQRSFRGIPRYLRMIVLLRKMRQYDESGTAIIVVGEEFRDRSIGQMAYPAHYPLLHRPGIGP